MLSAMTGERLADYCAHLRRQGRAPATIAHRRRVLALAARELGDLADVDPADAADWLAGRCPETRKAYSACLRGYAAWCAHHRLPGARLADELPRVRVPRGLPRPVDTAVLDQALALADRPWDRAALIACAYAGCRVGEVASLRPDDVEATGTGGHRLRVTGKGGVTRSAPMPSWAADELVRWLPVDLSTTTIRHRLTRLIAAAGGTGGPHRLRHWYATSLLAASGGNLLLVQQALGHASPQTTAIYCLLDSDAATAAAEAMPRPRRHLRAV